MTVDHFLVPLDFSTYAEQALDYAIALAPKPQARLTLLHVIQLQQFGASADMDLWPSATFLQELEAEITHDMEAYLARVTTAGLEGEIVVVHGVSFQEILDTAKARQVDLIIMGTHGRTGLTHVLMGSVAEKVVRLPPKEGTYPACLIATALQEVRGCVCSHALFLQYSRNVARCPVTGQLVAERSISCAGTKALCPQTHEIQAQHGLA